MTEEQLSRAIAYDSTRKMIDQAIKEIGHLNKTECLEDRRAIANDIAQILRRDNTLIGVVLTALLKKREEITEKIKKI